MCFTNNMNSLSNMDSQHIRESIESFRHVKDLEEVWHKRDALDVANWFIVYSGYTKTHMQIQKLSYIAHGYMLGIHGEALIRDQVEAWKLGPVYSTIYQEFKRWKFNPIGQVRYTPEPFTEKQQDVLENVFGSYGRFCGYYLSDITHDNSDTTTPWRQHYIDGASHIPIPDSSTKKYYTQLYAEYGYDY